MTASMPKVSARLGKALSTGGWNIGRTRLECVVVEAGSVLRQQAPFLSEMRSAFLPAALGLAGERGHPEQRLPSVTSQTPGGLQCRDVCGDQCRIAPRWGEPGACGNVTSAATAFALVNLIEPTPSRGRVSNRSVFETGDRPGRRGLELGVRLDQVYQRNAVQPTVTFATRARFRPSEGLSRHWSPHTSRHTEVPRKRLGVTDGRPRNVLDDRARPQVPGQQVGDADLHLRRNGGLLSQN